MNIFALDVSPLEAARAQTDKHVVKMVLETAQLLSTAHAVLDGASPGYKPTHRNHPCAVWLRESTGNYRWLYDHFTALCSEYTFRYDKQHKTESLVYALFPSPANLTFGPRTKFALAMPDEYKVECPIESYRNYYRFGKKDLHKWTGRARPSWL